MDLPTPVPPISSTFKVRCGSSISINQSSLFCINSYFIKLTNNECNTVRIADNLTEIVHLYLIQIQTGASASIEDRVQSALLFQGRGNFEDFWGHYLRDDGIIILLLKMSFSHFLTP